MYLVIDMFTSHRFFSVSHQQHFFFRALVSHCEIDQREKKMSRKRNAWSKTPTDLLRELIEDPVELELLLSKADNLKKSKDKKDFAFTWEVNFKDKKYRAGGFDESSG